MNTIKLSKLNKEYFLPQEINNPENLKELREEIISKMIEQNQSMGFYDNTPTNKDNIIEE